MFRKLIKVFILFNLFGNCVNLLRINSKVISVVDESIFVMLLKLFILLFSVIAFFLVFNLKTIGLKGSNVLYKFFSFTSIVNFIGLIIGFLNGFTDKLVVDFITFSSGPLICLAVSGIKLEVKDIIVLNKFISRSLFIIFLVFFVLVYIELFLGLPIYPALNPAVFAFILPYYWYFGDRKIQVISVILLLLGLKRSILIAVVLSIIPFRMVIRSRSTFSKALLKSTFGSFIMIVSLLYVMSFVEKNDFGFAGTMVNKFSTVNPFSDRFDFELGSGERVEEIVQSLNALKEYPLGTFIGAGNGFVYELDIERKDFLNEEHHNVHFSPVLYITRYGYIIMFVFYFSLIGIISKGVHVHRDRRVMYPWIFYSIYGLFSTFFSFSLSSDILFWISIGVILNPILMRSFKNNKSVFTCVE